MANVNHEYPYPAVLVDTLVPSGLYKCPSCGTSMTEADLTRDGAANNIKQTPDGFFFRCCGNETTIDDSSDPIPLFEKAS